MEPLEKIYSILEDLDHPDRELIVDELYRVEEYINYLKDELAKSEFFCESLSIDNEIFGQQINCLLDEIELLK